MWCEELKNDKVRFVERYTNPMTGKLGKVSVTMDKNSAATRKIALQVLNDKIDMRLKAITSIPLKKEITLKDLIASYQKDQIKSVAQSTYKRNYFACNSLMRILGADTLINRINAGYVREKFNATNDESGTLNERLARFKALIRWGYENDYIEDIRYLDKLKKYQDKEKKERLKDKFLEANELKGLLSNMQVDRWRLLTALTALSGMRAGEAIALELSDIDLENCLIHVNKTRDYINDIVTSPKTACSNREIYMQDELLALCRKIKAFTLSGKLKYCYDTKLFLCDINGDYVDYYAYNKYLREVSERLLGRNVTTHVMRHTHVALMAEAGISLDSISRRLGHESSQITKEVYYHVTKRMQERENAEIKNISFL